MSDELFSTYSSTSQKSITGEELLRQIDELAKSLPPPMPDLYFDDIGILRILNGYRNHRKNKNPKAKESYHRRIQKKWDKKAIARGVDNKTIVGNDKFIVMAEHIVSRVLREFPEARILPLSRKRLFDYEFKPPKMEIEWQPTRPVFYSTRKPIGALI